MRDYQREFIEFVLDSQALQFGEFTLKSGRTSPYFVNTGKFDTGAAISRLGHFYAAAIQEAFGTDVDVVFGPAYSAIPLCVAAASSLAAEHGMDAVGYTFDRKEAKDHGEKGITVGYGLADGQRVVMVDDVMTTGQTKYDAVDLLKHQANLEIVGLVIALDRQEQGTDGGNAIAAFTEKTGVPVHAIVSVRDVIAYLTETSGDHHLGRGPAESSGTQQIRAMEQYLDQYGV